MTCSLLFKANVCRLCQTTSVHISPHLFVWTIPKKLSFRKLFIFFFHVGFVWCFHHETILLLDLEMHARADNITTLNISHLHL